MFQKGKQSSRVGVFSLEFAFILVSLGGYLLTPGILASSAFGHGKSSSGLPVPGDKRSLNTEKSAVSTSVRFL